MHVYICISLTRVFIHHLILTIGEDRFGSTTFPALWVIYDAHRASMKAVDLDYHIILNDVICIVQLNFVQKCERFK